MFPIMHLSSVAGPPVVELGWPVATPFRGRRGRGGAHLGMRIGRCRRLPWMLPCLTTTSSTAVFFGTCLLLLLKAIVLCLLCLFE